VVVTGRAGETHQTLLEAGACMVSDKPVEYENVVRAVGACRASGGPGPHARCHMRSPQHGHQLVPLRRK
jgi:hypothetical protein